MIIYVTRHGQTTGDIENRYGGDYDDHLTDVGKEQAGQLANHLVDQEIEQLYASPLLRAQETATIIASKIGLTAVTTNDFKERNSYGILTGMVKDEAAKKYPDQVEILKDIHGTVEGAEPYAIFQARITAALTEAAHEEAQKVAIVTHGGPIRLIFRDILKLGEVDVDDCGYIVLKASGDKYDLLETSGIVRLTT